MNADENAIHQVAAGLEQAWNNADGEAFGNWFAEDAQFVNVHGLYAEGRRAIAENHQTIFTSIYAASTVRYMVFQIRLLADGVAVAHLRAHLSVPRGAMAGEHDALPSMVLTRAAGEWKIAAFHNTFVAKPPFQL